MATRREKRLQKAEKLVRRGKLEAAIEELHLVLKESPDDTRTLNRVGDLYARLNRVDEAADLFNRAAERFSKEGFFVKAIAIYKKILRLDPTRIPIYERLAELYQHQGLTTEARGQYQILADYYDQQNDATAVITVYEKLVELDPGDSDSGVRLGELLAEADRREEAVEVYRDVATRLLDAGEPDQAIVVYEQALEAVPEDLKFVMNAVMQLQSVDRPQLVERFLSRAEELNPEARTARALLEKTTPVEESSEPEAIEAPPEESEAAEEIEIELIDDDAAPPSVEPEDAAAAVEEVPEAPPAEPEADEFEIELGAFEDPAEPEDDEQPAAPDTTALDEAALDSLAVEEEVVETPPAEEAAEEPPVAEPTTEEEAAVELLVEEPESAPPSVEELLAEADALAGYGLEAKAAGRLTSALELEPENLAVYRRLIGIEVRARRDSDVVRLASEAARLALESGAAAQWRDIAADLERHGYRIEGSRLIPPPPPVAEIPGELLVDEPAAAAEPEEAPESAESVAGPAAAAAVEGGPTIDQQEDAWLDSLEDGEPTAAGAPAAAASDGEQFFDLGAELEMELGAEEAEDGSKVLEGQSVEEIVEGFKQGMAEVLSPEAYDTHYNLGVAYREMGLVDEAIGEFQLAAKDPRYLVECCSLLGQCFQEKDFGDLALKWYRKGLESPHVTEEATLGLLYEMGNLYLANGDRDAAREAFAEIYGINSNFRDVVAKLEELRD